MYSVIKWPRLLFAILLAPLCTPIVLMTWGFFVNGLNREYGWREMLRGELAGVLLYWLAAEAVAMLLGIPTLFLYRRLRLTSWGAYTLGGALISQIAAFILTLTGTLYFLTGQPLKTRAWLDAAPAFLLSGVSSALLFRWMTTPRDV